MTVSSQTSTATFVGNGVATAFPLPFRFFENGDIRAYFIDIVTGAATQMVLGSDYTLIGAGEPEVDGNALSLLTTATPLASMRGLYVERVMPQVQETDIVNQGQFFASTHEDVFDRLTMLIQQANANSAGAIRVAIGDPEPTRLVPAVSRANMLMGFDSSGDPIAVVPASGSAADLAMMLANNSDPSKGAALVGFSGRTIADKLNEMKSLNDYSGSDKSKFDQAIADLPAIGGSIVAPAGSYTFSGVNITKPVNIICLGGFDGGVKFINDSATVPFFTATGVSGISISGFSMTAGVTRTSGAFIKTTNCNRVSIERFFMQDMYIAIDCDGGSEIFIDKFAMFDASPLANSGFIKLGSTNYTGAVSIPSGYMKCQVPANQCGFGIRIGHVDVIGIGSGVTAITCGKALLIDPQSGQTASLIRATGAILDTSENGMYVAPGTGGKVIRCDFDALWAGENTVSGVVLDGTLGTIDGIRFNGGDFLANASSSFNIIGANTKNIRLDSPMIAASGIGIRAVDGCNFVVDGGIIGNYGQSAGNVTGLATDGTCSGSISNVNFIANTANVSGAVGAIQMFDNIGIDNWVTFTPVVTAASGSITSYTATGRSLKRRKTFNFQISISITNAGTAGGAILVTLPVNARVTSAFAGRETAVTGKTLQGYLAGASNICSIAYYDGAFPGATGTNLVVCGTYEEA